MGILVFDLGTSSMRGVLMNEQADILCQFQEKYHPDFHLSIYVTQNPEIWRSVLYDILRSYVAANEGVFECIPPESEEGTWEIKQILDEASSDMAFADFDNDGELEMLTISPFHGEKISIFKKTDAEKLTFTADLLDSDVGPANVLHYTNKRLYFVCKQRN